MIINYFISKKNIIILTIQGLNKLIKLIYQGLLITFLFNTVAYATKNSPKIIETPPIWTHLNHEQQTALQPIQSVWASVDSHQKQKWLNIAHRYPNLTPLKQQRLHERMKEWIQLSPEERHQIKGNFLSVLSSPNTLGMKETKDLHKQWQTYQSLSPEDKAIFLKKTHKKIP